VFLQIGDTVKDKSDSNRFFGVVLIMDSWRWVFSLPQCFPWLRQWRVTEQQ